MENALYIGLSRQVALQREMNLVANNIANVNTPGYRADKMLFSEYISTPDAKPEDISMVYDSGQYKDTQAGKMSYTGRPLDVALDGPGFLLVQTDNGTQYSRMGNLTLNADGVLVNSSGDPILTAGEGEISIPTDAKEINITSSGEIITDKGSAGTIGVVEFENVIFLRPTGKGYYETVDNVASQPAEDTILKQGMIEGSNVEGVLEMTDMIEISRQFQSMQRLLQNEHERQQSVIQTLTDIK